MKFDLKKEQLTLLLLRLGLAFVFTYAAVAALMHPDQWIGYLPSFIAKMHYAETILKLLSVGQIFLALWLLVGKFVRYAALLAAAMFVGIVLAQPGDLIISFRDIGLLCMALALAASA